MEISRESIFLSSLRKFFHSFFGVIGFFIALIPIIFILSIFGSDAEKISKNVLTYLPDLKGRSDVLPSSSPVILRININGEIGSEDLTWEQIQSQLFESQKGALKQGRVKGILLHLQTPGGGVNDSDMIYQILAAYKKQYNVPIYAFVDGISASGGTYISCASDKIFATPSSIVGSVGVISGPYFNVSKTMEKVGLEALTFSEGKDKDMLNPTRPWKEKEGESLTKIDEASYEMFVDVVTKSRPKLDREKLINEYGAQVFIAKEAKDLGYIDEVGTYHDALFSLLEEAKIDPDKPYQVVELKPKRRWIADLVRGESLLNGKLKHSLHLGGEQKANSSGIMYLYNPAQ